MSLYVLRGSAVAARSFDNEIIIMSTRDSTLFTLNHTASEIWRAADGRTPLDRIVRDHVCGQFEVSEEEAVADAEALCRDLAARGILTISDEPIEAETTS